MRAVITRVKSASVTRTGSGETLGAIGKGFLVLLGVHAEDPAAQADKIADRICVLRVFEDEAGKTNLSLQDVGGSLLLVSQFTLYADCRKGNRPGFSNAGDPAHARMLYDYIVSECTRQVPVVQTGQFGADMKVHLTNDGPFTILLDEHILPARLSG